MFVEHAMLANQTSEIKWIRVPGTEGFLKAVGAGTPQPRGEHSVDDSLYRQPWAVRMDLLRS
jgi:hypothetical protein